MLSAEETQDIVKAVVANAKKLGLTWDIQTAKVVGNSNGASAIGVQHVGDTGEPIPAVSLIGTPVIGAIVYTISVPPAGLYIVGNGRGATARSEIFEQTQSPTGSGSGIGTVAAQLAGSDIEVSVLSNARWEAWVDMDFRCFSFAGNTVGEGWLYVDGVQTNNNAFFGLTAVGQRGTGAFSASGTLTPGTHSFQLWAAQTAGLGDVRVGGNSTLKVKAYE